MSNSEGTVNLPGNLRIKVGGSLLSDDVMKKFVESRVSRSIGAACRLELRFDDGDVTLVDASTFEIGKTVQVEISDRTGKYVPVFDGEFTAIGIEQVRGMNLQLVVEAFDRSHRLSRNSKVRTFLKTSYADVVRKICKENGLTAQVVATPVVHEYLLLHGSDWAKLDEIAFRTGLEWLVDGEKLILRERPNTAGPDLKHGDDLLTFRARYSAAENVASVEVRSWDRVTKKAIVGTDGNSGTDLTGANEPGGVAAFRRKARNAVGAAAGEIINGSYSAETLKEASTMAESLARRSGRHELSARGEVIGNPQLKAGERVGITGFGKKMSGQYYLTEVEHVFNQRGLVTRFTAGGPETESIVDLLAGSTGSTSSSSVTGLVVGVVTNIKDPLNLHRVKVKFPTLSNQDESDWSRIATPMAGKLAGVVMMPSVNDEVIVGFEQGDLRRAYVLGALWSNVDKPPDPMSVVDGKIEHHQIKTLTGHVLSFTEKEGEESIRLIHGKAADSKLSLEKEKVQLWVMGDKMVEIKAGQATIVLDKGSITITGKEVEVKGTQELKLNAPNIEIKASNKLAISGAVVEIKASTKADVDGGGVLTLKGGMTKIN